MVSISGVGEESSLLAHIHCLLCIILYYLLEIHIVEFLTQDHYV